jgi:uronate dehydrogenase
MTVIITGAAGTIGKAVAAALTAEAIPVRLLDIRPQHQVPAHAHAHAQRVDLRDLTATIQATVGGSVLIHLAGITEEAPFPDICEHNILGTYHVLEAARRNHIPRVVLASSHHTIGFTPTDQQVSTTSATAPDSFYAVSKITGEAL